jgi:hypothetical protein
MSVPYSPDQYGDAIRAEYGGGLGGGTSMQGGMAWMAVMLVALPLIAFLVVVGLVYELVVRVSRHRLPSLVDWTVALLGAAALVGIGVVLVSRPA